MNDKLTLQELIDLLAARHQMEPQDADAFVKGFWTLIEEGLKSDNYVKIKGLGTFKLIDTEARESINIQTGERIEIQSHARVTFTPEASLRDLINRPFAHFETVVLNESTNFDDLVEDDDDKEDREGKDDVDEEEMSAEESTTDESITDESTTDEPETIESAVDDSVSDVPIEDNPVLDNPVGVDSVEETEAIDRKEDSKESDHGMEQPDSVVVKPEVTTVQPVSESDKGSEPSIEYATTEDKPSPNTQIFRSVVYTLLIIALIGGLSVLFISMKYGSVWNFIAHCCDKAQTASPTLVVEDHLDQTNKAQVRAETSDSTILINDSLSLSTQKADEISTKEKDSTEEEESQASITPTDKKNPTTKATSKVVVIDASKAASGTVQSSTAKKTTQKSDSVKKPIVKETVKDKEQTPAVSKHKQQAKQPPKYLSEQIPYKIVGSLGTYTIRPGETLTRVALRYYGNKKIWPYIVLYNQTIIKNPDNVPIGTTLRIPKLEPDLK